MTHSTSLRILIVFVAIAVTFASASPLSAADPTATPRPTLRDLLDTIAALQSRVSGLETRLAAVEGRLDKLEKTASAAPTPPAVPTVAGAPTATPGPAPAGAAKDVGQSWETDGVSLTLSNVAFERDSIHFDISLDNKTRQTIAFNDLSLALTDNIGGQYTLDGCSGYPGACKGPVSLANGQPQKWTAYWRGPFSDDQVQYLVVTAGASRVKNATWRIPVFH
jgi:hypothetical protein